MSCGDTKVSVHINPIWQCIFLLCAAFLSTVPDCSYAVWAYKDDVEPVPGRRSSEMFFIPSAMVTLYGFPKYLDYSKFIIERWEYRVASQGYAAGYIQYFHGKRQMCVCSKRTYILSPGLVAEMYARRMSDEEGLTDLNDFTLDEKIRLECESRGSYQGCFDITEHPTPDLPGFCNAFIRDSDSKILPMAFSRQSYFAPGARIIDQVEGKSPKVEDVYASDVSWLNKPENCTGAHGESSACQGKILVTSRRREKNKPGTSRIVSRENGSVCVDYTDLNNKRGVDCVPAPAARHPVVSPTKDESIRVQFENCIGSDGKDMKYCDFTMRPGDRDKAHKLLAMKPKFNLEKYSFELNEACLKSNADSATCNAFNVYKEDPQGNVVCLMSPQFFPKKFYVKRGTRYHWISELPSVLVARSYNQDTKKYVLCDDGKSVDLSLMSQEEIDKISLRGRDFSLPGRKKDSKKVCEDNLSYRYDNDRVFRHDNPSACSTVSRELVTGPYCKTRYISEDYHKPFFLQESEEVSESALVPRNHMMQGLCVASNFPTHEYKYRREGDVSGGSKRINRHLLEVNEENTQCDFIRIEMWGGGESGSLGSSSSSKPGEYVMAVLKVNPKESKYLIHEIGHGGVAKLEHALDDVKFPGGDTKVSICDNIGDKVCPIELVAKGGGQQKVILPVGHEKLVHYRLSEGRQSAMEGEVLIPYQDYHNATGLARISDVGCTRGPGERSTGQKVVDPAKYPGAGGCSNIKENLLQSGSPGMVKITCEKWSGSPGQVKEWEGSFCDKKLLQSLIALKDYSVKKGIQESTELLSEIANEDFCEDAGNVRGLKGAIENILAVVNGEDIVKESENARTSWKDAVMHPLRQAVSLNKQELFGDRDSLSKGMAHSPSGYDEQRERKFLNTFEMLVDSKVTVHSRKSRSRAPRAPDFKSEGHCSEYLIDSLNTISSIVGENDRSGIFSKTSNEDLCYGLSLFPGVAREVWRISNVINGPRVMVGSEKSLRIWRDASIEPLKAAIKEAVEINGSKLSNLLRSVARANGDRGSEREDYTERLINSLGGAVATKAYIDKRASSENITRKFKSLEKDAATRGLGISNVFKKLADDEFVEVVASTPVSAENFVNLLDEISDAMKNGDIKKFRDGGDFSVERILNGITRTLGYESKVVGYVDNTFTAYKSSSGNGPKSSNGPKTYVRRRHHCNEYLMDSLNTISGVKGPNSGGIFSRERNKDLCHGIGLFPHVVNELRRISNLVKGPKVMMGNEEGISAWMDLYYTAPLRKAIEKTIQESEDEFPNVLRSLTQTKGAADTKQWDYVEKFVSELEEVVASRAHLDPRAGSKSIVRKLRGLNAHPIVHGLGIGEVFERLANDEFAKIAISIPGSTSNFMGLLGEISHTLSSDPSKFLAGGGFSVEKILHKLQYALGYRSNVVRYIDNTFGDYGKLKPNYCSPGLTNYLNVISNAARENRDSFFSKAINPDLCSDIGYPRIVDELQRISNLIEGQEVMIMGSKESVNAWVDFHYMNPFRDAITGGGGNNHLPHALHSIARENRIACSGGPDGCLKAFTDDLRKLISAKVYVNERASRGNITKQLKHLEDTANARKLDIGKVFAKLAKDEFVNMATSVYIYDADSFVDLLYEISDVMKNEPERLSDNGDFSMEKTLSRIERALDNRKEIVEFLDGVLKEYKGSKQPKHRYRVKLKLA